MSRVENIHNSKSWTEEEDKLIRRYASDINKVLYHLAHRTVHSIKARARRIGVTLKKPKTTVIWAQEEEGILRNNSNLPARELAVLIPTKSQKHIRDKAIELGFSLCRPTTRWTDKEDTILREHYLNKTVKELSQGLLTGRSEQGILSRCIKLGLRKQMGIIYDSRGYTICSICNKKKQSEEMTPESSVCKKCTYDKAKHVISLRQEQGFCIICGESEPTEGSRLCTICLKAKSRSFQLKKRQRKQQAIDYLGGRCLLCGLESDIVDVFDFHHLNAQKDKDISELIKSATWKNLKKELDNCIVLCCDCHILWHYFYGKRNTKNWTQTEDDMLREVWLLLTKEELKRIFPRRTWKGIHERAKKLCLRKKLKELENKEDNGIEMGSALDVVEPETPLEKHVSTVQR